MERGEAGDSRISTAPPPSSACKVPPPVDEWDAVVHWEILRYPMLAISYLVIGEINLENLSAHNFRTSEHLDSNKTALRLCTHKCASVCSTPPFPWQFGWVWCKYGVCAFLLVRKGSKCLHTASLPSSAHLNPSQQILPDSFKNTN